jgi:uncharacterized protein YeaO (DUF488 family)
MDIQIKRAYEEAEKSDGTRILVDRLWPRGVTKAKADIDLWLKDIAPSTELRKWFGHDPEKWKEFQRRYKGELRDKTDLLEMIEEKVSRGTVTLVYGARDEEHNEAAVLKQYIEQRSGQ